MKLRMRSLSAVGAAVATLAEDSLGFFDEAGGHLGTLTPFDG